MTLLLKNPFVGYMTDDELASLPIGSTLVFDIECYPNCFLIGFGSLKNRKVYQLVGTDDRPLNTNLLHWIVRSFHLVGYYSTGYDCPMTWAALRGWSCRQLHEMSSKMIEQNISHWKVKDVFGIETPFGINHVDIAPVVPLQNSLKMRGAQMHFESIQELPYNPHKELTGDEMREVGFYNINDLAVTAHLFEQLKEEYQLRCEMSAKYGIDVRSKSDAQIAEAVIGNSLKKLTGSYPKKPGVNHGATYKFKKQPWMTFSSTAINQVLTKLETEEFSLKESGHIQCPKWLEDAKIKIDDGVYRMGIGGLHSSEETRARVAHDGRMLVDVDVTSFYPFIILNQQLYSKTLGSEFLTIFKDIVDTRVAAKAAGDKVVAGSMKIIVNGTFGKLSDPYSIFYDPGLLLQVTLSGQLTLLHLIDSMWSLGFTAVSANTDGVVFSFSGERREAFDACLKQWMSQTGFNLESTDYRALYSRDVNNYIAHKKKGGIKSKGAYSNPWLSSDVDRFRKNPDAIICSEALEAFLTDNKSIRETIYECQDICKFVIVRKVKTGAWKDGHPLGKTVRWYYSKTTNTPITTAEGDKVARSDKGMPAQTLSQDMLTDVDREAYITETESMLRDIGFVYKKSIFD